VLGHAGVIMADMRMDRQRRSLGSTERRPAGTSPRRYSPRKRRPEGRSWSSIRSSSSPTPTSGEYGRASTAGRVDPAMLAAGEVGRTKEQGRYGGGCQERLQGQQMEAFTPSATGPSGAEASPLEWAVRGFSAGSRPCSRREFPAARSFPKSCPTALMPITQRRMSEAGISWSTGTKGSPKSSAGSWRRPLPTA